MINYQYNDWDPAYIKNVDKFIAVYENKDYIYKSNVISMIDVPYKRYKLVEVENE